MREAQAASPNALSALGSVIRLLERELGRSDDAPMLIYEKIMQALRRMAMLCDQGELPAGSIDIEDFRQALNNTTLVLMLNDSRVREAVEKRAAFHVSQLSPEEQAHITVLAQGLQPISSESLGTRMLEDSETAVDADADPIDCSGAIYQYGSTVVGMTSANRKMVEGVATASGITSFIMSVINWFQ